MNLKIFNPWFWGSAGGVLMVGLIYGLIQAGAEYVGYLLMGPFFLMMSWLMNGAGWNVGGAESLSIIFVFLYYAYAAYLLSMCFKNRKWKKAILVFAGYSAIDAASLYLTGFYYSKLITP